MGLPISLSEVPFYASFSPAMILDPLSERATFPLNKSLKIYALGKQLILLKTV